MQEYFRHLLDTDSPIKISVVSIHYPYNKSVYSWKNITIYPCGGRGAVQPKRLFYWLRAIFLSLKINKQTRVTLIHSFWLSETGLIGFLLSKLFRVRHINTMMGQDVKAENKYLKFLPLDSIIKIAVSEFQSEVFYQSTGEKPDYIIPWGIEELSKGNYERKIDIVGVGALIPVKNFKLFVNIIAELKKDFPSIKCLLIGEGTERHEIEFIIEKNNLTDNILLSGHIVREEVLDYMRKSKILLHTSIFESFGYVIEEALVLGCYVVCSNIGCARESKKVLTLNGSDEIVPAVINILKNNSDYNPELLYPISETVSSYLDLYENYYVKKSLK
jgi:glycosyltransferase involved in cell wall biosynthesis